MGDWRHGSRAISAVASMQGQEKMSKSDPNSAIFMEDSKEDVDRKIKKAFCPPNVVQGNPCLKYIQLIILPWSGSFTVTFSKDGGREKCAALPSMTRPMQHFCHPAALALRSL